MNSALMEKADETRHVRATPSVAATLQPWKIPGGAPEPVLHR
jgi:hypothetical protein